MNPTSSQDISASSNEKSNFIDVDDDKMVDVDDGVEKNDFKSQNGPRNQNVNSFEQETFASNPTTSYTGVHSQTSTIPHEESHSDSRRDSIDKVQNTTTMKSFEQPLSAVSPPILHSVPNAFLCNPSNAVPKPFSNTASDSTLNSTPSSTTNTQSTTPLIAPSNMQSRTQSGTNMTSGTASDVQNRREMSKFANSVFNERQNLSSVIQRENSRSTRQGGTDGPLNQQQISHPITTANPQNPQSLYAQKPSNQILGRTPSVTQKTESNISTDPQARLPQKQLPITPSQDPTSNTNIRSSSEVTGNTSNSDPSSRILNSFSNSHISNNSGFTSITNTFTTSNAISHMTALQAQSNTKNRVLNERNLQSDATSTRNNTFPSHLHGDSKATVKTMQIAPASKVITNARSGQNTISGSRIVKVTPYNKPQITVNNFTTSKLGHMTNQSLRSSSSRAASSISRSASSEIPNIPISLPNLPNRDSSNHTPTSFPSFPDETPHAPRSHTFNIDEEEIENLATELSMLSEYHLQYRIEGIVAFAKALDVREEQIFDQCLRRWRSLEERK